VRRAERGKCANGWKCVEKNESGMQKMYRAGDVEPLLGVEAQREREKH
jgi:hypothetical protein